MSSGISITARFAAPQLLNLGPPPALAAQDFDTLLAAERIKLAAELSAVGIPYDVQGQDTDPAVRVTRAAVGRDVLRRQAIDEAVAQTFLGSATGAMLDRRAADYGVLRRSQPHTITTPAPESRPASVPPLWEWDAASQLWREDDESLRLQARLAWEALSVAGPPGAYIYNARRAHPDVRDAVVYGPETNLVEPGQVLVVVQSFSSGGIPPNAVVDSVAYLLDAYAKTYANGATTTQLIRNDQAVRPLGAQVFVEAARPRTWSLDAIIYVPADADRTAVKALALTRLAALTARHNRVADPITLKALAATLSLPDASGVPTAEAVINAPTGDVIPSYREIVTVVAPRIDVRSK